MDYNGLPRTLLASAGANIGDRASITSAGQTQEGVVMPRHMLTAGDILVLKLDSGYNVGIRISNSDSISLIEKAEQKEKISRESEASGPLVSFISTGGTIASYVDYKTGAVHPAVTAEDLVFSVPELSEICTPKGRVLTSILSENMNVELWVRLADAIVEEFEAGAKGVVVPHGTDTLGYTAAALSFMLQELPGPVVLVGSQRSSDRPSSDANMNLLAATKVALSPIGEVVAVMHDTSSDTRCAIHRGTRVRKSHTSKRDAFQSINSPPIGFVEEDGVTILEEVREPSNKASADTRMDSNVIPIYAYPGITPDRFRRMVNGASGVVILGTGLGHVADFLTPAIEDMTEKGTLIAMTSQCIRGRTNLNVYSTGRDLLEAGVIPCEDMLPETALVKLMWALGRSEDLEEAKMLFLEDAAGEISSRSLHDPRGE